MQKWEYRVVEIYIRRSGVTYEKIISGNRSLKIEDNYVTKNSNDDDCSRPLHHHIRYLNHLGQEGWEVINIQPGDNGTLYYLKRPIESGRL